MDRVQQKMSRSTRVALALISLCLIQSRPCAQAASLRLVRQFGFTRTINLGENAATIAFDSQYAYVSSPDDGVLRTVRLDSTSPLESTGFASEIINNIYVYSNALYVLISPPLVPPGMTPEHALLESDDHGQTYFPIDDGLLTCDRSGCGYLSSSELIVRPTALFVNAGAGRNLLVSKDTGKNWVALSGSIAGMVCTFSPFELIGPVVLQGGECPLDSAFLDIGILSPNMTGLVKDLAPAQTPDLENRNIQFIMTHPIIPPVVLAGAEGALLMSRNGGASWRYVIKEPIGSAFYPYIQHALFPSRNLTMAIIGGFDKGSVSPYLAFGSPFTGRFSDISNLLNVADGGVTSITEDAVGRIFIAVADLDAKEIKIYQFTF